MGNKKPSILLLVALFVLIAAFVGVGVHYFGRLLQPRGGIFIGRAEAGEEKKPERIKHVNLPKGYKLVNVATQCFSGGFCEPWWLLQSSNDPTFFLYTNGEKEYSFTENK